MSLLHDRLPCLPGFFTAAPSAPLAAHVQRFWWLEGELGQVDEQMLHPDGGTGLIFNFAEPLLFNGDALARPALLAGPQVASTRLQLPGRTNLMGVRFRPGMGALFLGVGLDELSGFQDADTPRPAIAALAEQLAGLDRHAQQARVEAHLLACLAAPSPRRSAVQLLLARIAASEGRARLGDLLMDVPLGQRQLERRFRLEVGLTPKQFGRIQRVALVRRELRNGGPLLATALACGYSDQAHLIHDFKTVVGMTPGQYQRRARLAGQ